MVAPDQGRRAGRLDLDRPLLPAARRGAGDVDHGGRRPRSRRPVTTAVSQAFGSAFVVGVYVALRGDQPGSTGVDPAESGTP